MIDNTTIARPYAKAAFEAARDSNTVDAWSRFFKVLSDLLDHKEVRALLKSPVVTPKQAAETLDGLLSDVLGSDFSNEERNFMALIAENDRFFAVDEMRKQFEERKDRYQGVAEAIIETAMPIEESMLARLVKSLESHFGCQVRTKVVELPELIGGVRIKVGDEVIDASVRGDLNRMANALTQ